MSLVLLFVYIVNVCKQSLIKGGGQLLGNDDARYLVAYNKCFQVATVNFNKLSKSVM